MRSYYKNENPYVTTKPVNKTKRLTLKLNLLHRGKWQQQQKKNISTNLKMLIGWVEVLITTVEELQLSLFTNYSDVYNKGMTEHRFRYIIFFKTINGNIKKMLALIFVIILESVTFQYHPYHPFVLLRKDLNTSCGFPICFLLCTIRNNSLLKTHDTSQ